MPAVGKHTAADDATARDHGDRPGQPAKETVTHAARTAAAARGAKEVREARTRHTSGSSTTLVTSPPAADDGAARPDDEQVDAAGEVGQPVIERVLGGVVIGELDA